MRTLQYFRLTVIAVILYIYIYIYIYIYKITAITVKRKYCNVLIAFHHLFQKQKI